MKQTQMAPVHHQHFPAGLHHTLPHHAGGERKQKRAGVSNFTMSDCYEKLKQLVPTIPKNRKVSRVEILQHVIDYIQDLQTALEGRNIDVKMMGNMTALTGMLSEADAMPAPAMSNRAPFTTIVPQQQLSGHQPQPMTCPPATPLGLHTQSNVRQQQMQLQQQRYPQQTTLFQHQGFNEYHHRQQMNLNSNMTHPQQQQQAQHHHLPGQKLIPHPYETPESSPESRPCSC